ncbi:MAG: copper chaperone PCu(A)C [Sulfitobacter sp.]
MKQLITLVSTLVIIIAAYFVIRGSSNEVIVTNAQAIPVAGRDGLFMVTLDIQNDGPPKTVSGVSSPSARAATIMNPGHAGEALVIPAQSNGSFAMDGAHLMLMGAESAFEEGSFLPLTIEFAGYGPVATRVLNAGTGMGMDHSLSGGVAASPSPTLHIAADTGFHSSGSDISLTTQNFAFVAATEHQMHQGHAHIYLNGLKLGRLYETQYQLGALPAGTFTLEVALNTNTHRPYVHEGQKVNDTLTFTLE